MLLVYLLPLIGFAPWCLSVEVRIPAFDRRAKFFEMYDAKTDEFQLSTLTHDDYEVIVITDDTPSSTFDNFLVKSQLDYVDVLQVGGMAELNLAVGVLHGNVAASMDVRSDLKTDENTYLHVIKISKRTKLERADPCSSSLANYIYEDLLDLDANSAQYIVLGVVYGLEIEVHVKVTSSSKEEQKSLEASVSAEIGYMMSSLKASGSLAKKNGNRTSNENFSVSVRTTHFVPPYGQPKTLKDVPSYLDKVTKHVATSNLTGSVLEYIVEEKSNLRQCLLGKFQASSVDYSHSDLIVAKVRQVSFEIDIQDKENCKAMKKFEQSRFCLSDAEYNKGLQAKSSADDHVATLRMSLSDGISKYRAGNFTAVETLAQIERVLKRIGDDSNYMLNALELSLVSKATLVSTMVSYNVKCFQKSQNPLFISSDVAKKEVRYLAFRDSQMSELLSSDLPTVFGKSCLNENYSCYLLNCDFGFPVCEKLSGKGYYSVKDMIVFSHVSKTIELLEAISG